MKTRKHRFWIWLRELSKRKIREFHGHSRLCPKCKLWTHETDGCKSLVDCPVDSMVEIMECNQCGHLSRWRMDSFMPYPEEL